MNTEPRVVADPPLPSDSARARRATADFLARHCPWADLDAVLLVVSELVSNAVQHTAGWWRLHLAAAQDTLVVEIDDSSPAIPVSREPDFSGSGGFGWHMVHQLAGKVEISPLPCGKRVQATWVRKIPAAASVC